MIGDELYLKGQFEKFLISLHKESTILYYYPGEEQEARSSLYSIGLFEDRIIIFKYFDQMDTHGFPELIKQYDGFLLITLSDQANIKNTVMTSVLSHTVPVQCNKMAEYGADYPSWILSHGTEKGYVFIDGSEDILYRKVGPDLLTLLNELSKLVIYKQETKSIEPEDIERVVVGSAVGSAYQILDNILRKDVIKILKSTDQYLQGNEDIMGLVGFLCHYLEKMYRLLLMDEQKISADGMADILNISPFVVKTKYLPRVKSLGKGQIAQWIQEIGELDEKIRTFRGDKKILFFNFIFSIVSG